MNYYSSAGVKLDLSKYNNRLQEAQNLLDKLVLRDTEPYVRYDTGATNKSAFYLTKIGSGKVIYGAKNARGDYYAYYTYTNTNNSITKTFHPNATYYWFEASKEANKEKWIKEIQKEVTKHG